MAKIAVKPDTTYIIWIGESPAPIYVRRDHPLTTLEVPEGSKHETLESFNARTVANGGKTPPAPT